MDPIEDSVKTLFEELSLSVFWNRPSILIATYRSKLNCIDAQFWLGKKLKRIKQTIVNYQVNEENFDIPLILKEIPDKQNKIFFITSLSQGGGSLELNAFRALNFRRELLVEQKIRAVFWLEEKEADLLPTQALDFWAFRHRMVEMFNEPTSRRMVNLVRNLDWPAWDLEKLKAEIPFGLELRKELLAKIPDWKKSPSIRAELLHMIAGIYWANNEYSESLALLKKGLNIAQGQDFLPIKARLWIGMGLVQVSQGHPDLATQAFQNSLKLAPQSAEAWANLARIYRGQNQLNTALEAATKSVSIDPKFYESWILIGDISNELGMQENAALAFKKSLSIYKKDASTWIKLGDTYRLLGRPADSLPTFKNARLLELQNSDTWLKLGLAYRDVGLVNNAVRALYKAARLNPLGAIPWKKLGDIYRSKNNLINARKAYKAATSLDPLDNNAKYSLDACYLKKKTKK